MKTIILFIFLIALGSCANVSTDHSAAKFKQLFTDQELMIEPLDGQSYIQNAQNVFKAGIDDDFSEGLLDQSGRATNTTYLDIRELRSTRTFIEVFTSINSDLDKCTLSQHQIIRFCEKHPKLLNYKYYTHFLFKVDGEYFVAFANLSSAAGDNIAIYVWPLTLNRILLADDHARIVTPKSLYIIDEEPVVGIDHNN